MIAVPQGRTVAGIGVYVAAPTYEPVPAVPSLCCELATEPVSASRARRMVRERYSGCGPPDALDDLALVVTELVANAVAASPAGGRVVLRVRPAGDELLVEVYDVVEAAPQCRCPDDQGEDGRGLLLVRELSSVWGWSALQGGKAVWAVVPLARPMVAAS